MNNDTEIILEKLLVALERKEWKVIRKAKRGLSLNESFNSRYPAIPPDFLLFLSMIEACQDPSGKMWFLTEADYNRQGSAPLPWDHFEPLITRALMEEGDMDEAEDVKDFWDSYLPILQSGGGEYMYLAVGVREDTQYERTPR
jgi:hypothetical protein